MKLLKLAILVHFADKSEILKDNFKHFKVEPFIRTNDF